MGSKTDGRNLVHGPAICRSQLIANRAAAPSSLRRSTYAPLINERHTST